MCFSFHSLAIKHMEANETTHRPVATAAGKTAVIVTMHETRCCPQLLPVVFFYPPVLLISFSFFLLLVPSLSLQLRPSNERTFTDGSFRFCDSTDLFSLFFVPWNQGEKRESREAEQKTRTNCLQRNHLLSLMLLVCPLLLLLPQNSLVSSLP